MELGIAAIVIIGLIFFVVIISNFTMIKLYIVAREINLPITFLDIIFMKVRKVDYQTILEMAIFLKKSQIDVSLSDLEAQYLAGGNIRAVAFALYNAKRGKINTSFKQICAFDLAGRNAEECIKECLVPVDFNSDTVNLESKNGRNYKVSIKATFLKDINKLLGGADNQSLVNKIFDFIGSKIADSDSVIDPKVLEKEILDESFSKGFASNVKKIEIIM